MIPAAIVNEHLKRVLPVIGKANPQRVSQAVQVPFLTLDGSTADNGITKDDAKALNLFDDFGILRAPFPMFRFSSVTNKGTIFGFCERTTSAFAAIVFVRTEKGLGPILWACTYQSPQNDQIAFVPDGPDFICKKDTLHPNLQLNSTARPSGPKFTTT